MKLFSSLVPAYGRDYKSKAAILTDLVAQKDFIIANIMHQYDGKPCSARDLVADGYTHAEVRYSNLTKVAIVPLK